MLHQLQQSVDVFIPLGQVMTKWEQICHLLAEAPRKRKLQLQNRALLG